MTSEVSSVQPYGARGAARAAEGPRLEGAVRGAPAQRLRKRGKAQGAKVCGTALRGPINSWGGPEAGKSKRGALSGGIEEAESWNLQDAVPSRCVSETSPL